MVFYVQLPKTTFDLDCFNKLVLNDNNIVLSNKTTSLTIWESDVESEYYLDELYYELGEHLNRYGEHEYVQLPKVTFNLYEYNRLELNEEKQQIVLYENNKPEIYINFDSVSDEYETLEDLYIELSDSLMKQNEEADEIDDEQTIENQVIVIDE